jgi:formylglycine-generating enzyme required for sulfatase activity
MWTIGLGALLGLGLGACALFALKGVIGAAACLFTLGFVFWWAKDAEPVFVQPEAESQPRKATKEPEPEPEPQIVEPQLVEPLDMVALPGGTFLMGSSDSDQDAYDNEKPQHEVAVSTFLISRFPITRQLYRRILEQSLPEWDRDATDDQLPANHVTWFQAVAFCNALSEYFSLSPCYRINGEHVEQVEWDRNADGYRLPTEAEWEYACRAGSTSKWFFGDDAKELDRYAWFTGNSGDKVQPVGKKDPNLWGLHDMSGNVWEWCWDWFAEYSSSPTQMLNDPTGPESGTRRVLRGGSAWLNPRRLRSADRDWYEPTFRDADDGFRCVRRPRR